eukprot:338025-Chlamydomonas_euryale.AAC.1
MLDTLHPCIVGHTASMHCWTHRILALLDTLHPCSVGHTASLQSWTTHIHAMSCKSAAKYLLFPGGAVRQKGHPLYKTGVHTCTACLHATTHARMRP